MLCPPQTMDNVPRGPLSLFWPRQAQPSDAEAIKHLWWAEARRGRSDQSWWLSEIEETSSRWIVLEHEGQIRGAAFMFWHQPTKADRVLLVQPLLAADEDAEGSLLRWILNEESDLPHCRVQIL